MDVRDPLVSLSLKSTRTDEPRSKLDYTYLKMVTANHNDDDKNMSDLIDIVRIQTDLISNETKVRELVEIENEEEASDLVGSKASKH